MKYDRKDAFHQRARREGYRSRAAYKLLEIQRRERLLRAGQKVADLGCWPGGWLQVAAQVVGPRGRVVGVDLAEIEPPLRLAEVHTVQADLADAETPEAILTQLGGGAGVVLCDAAPKLTGVRATDRANEEALLETVEGLLPRILAPGGDLLLKLLYGPEAQEIARRIGSGFEKARTLRPKATRKGSSEKYLLARRRKPASGDAAV